ncbi:MAG: leucine-rich repeat protein [Porphyromonadaceae bacterium]|nr:leucine-rich repeat protein [Porphyromonadaceae bacterium]
MEAKTDNTGTVVYNKNYKGEITIPNNKKINKIGKDAFLNCKEVTKITMGNNITIIEDSAFEGCENLQHIQLSEKLESIGKFAFFNCKNVKKITLSKSIESIGRSAFQNCKKLKDIEIFRGLKTIAAWTFAGCEQLETVIIPNGVKKIDHQAFANCHKLTKIETMSSESTLGYEVFYSVNKGQCSVTVPLFCKSRYEEEEQWKEFRIKEFDCFSVDGIRYKIKENADSQTLIVTQNKDYVGGVQIKNEVDFMGERYNVTAIEEEAFKGNKELTYVYIPQNIEQIGSSAFALCENLKYFLSDKAAGYHFKVDNEVLYDKNKEILLAYPAAKIEDKKSFTIPATVKQIANFAFSSFRYLERITFTNEVKFMGENIFQGANVMDCYAFIPKNASSKFIEYLHKWNFKNITASEYFIHKGINYRILSEEGATVEVAPNKGCVGKVEIPETLEYAGTTYTVVGVGDDAFKENEITSVKLPDTITSIGNDAFWDCEYLTSINIPTKVANIAPNAFVNTFSMVSFNVDKNNFYYSSNRGVLFNKSQMELIRYPSNKSDSSYIIPSSVTKIADNAFIRCYRLKSIHIPSSVTYIGSWDLTDYDELTTVTCASNTPSQAGWFGSINNICVLRVPLNCVEAYYKAEDWKIFKRITDRSILSEYFKHEGINYHVIDNKEKKLEVQYNYKCTMKEVNIPDTINLNGEAYTVEKIGQRAFFNNKEIERITLPNTIKTIGYKAFGSTNCIISSIPSSVEVIESKAFYRINEKNQFTIPQNIKSIHPKAFLFSKLKGFTEQTGTYFQVLSSVLINNKESQALCYPSTKNLEKLQLPTKVTNLGRHAFYCVDNLTTIVIPSTVNSIEFSFWGADKLQQLVMLSKQPPQFIGSRHLKKRCPIIVPKGCVNVYKTHPHWSRFTNIKEINVNLPTSNMAGYGISRIALK